jgi:hypothetical protein
MADWDKLIDKYFEGTSSIKDEEKLRVYFNSSKVEDRHKKFADLFADHTWNSLPEMEADPFEKINFRPEVKRINLYQISSIAAGLLLLIFAGLFTVKNDQIEQDFSMAQYEPANEEEAYEQTLMALEMLSKKFNNGTSSVEKGIHGLKKANEIINKNN